MVYKLSFYTVCTDSGKTGYAVCLSALVMLFACLLIRVIAFGYAVCLSVDSGDCLWLRCLLVC